MLLEDFSPICFKYSRMFHEENLVADGLARVGHYSLLDYLFASI